MESYFFPCYTDFMKLALDCRMIGSGGIGTYFLSILPYLLRNFECLLFGNEKLINENIKQIQIRNESDNSYKSTFLSFEVLQCSLETFSLKELFFFPRSLLEKINECAAYYTPYCNIPGGIKIPVFSTIHDVVFLDIPSLTSKIGLIARKFFYQRAINRSKAIFTVSNFSAERIKAHLKVKNKPVIVTYNAVPEWFTDQADYNSSEKSDIIYVGNIKAHKGLHILIPAFIKALENGLKANLLIVGNADNFRTSDTSILSQISDSKNITFTGRISDEELHKLYHKSSLLIQPSLYEGFGMPPMEALSCGTNVIISDIPVFKEIYKDFPVTFFKSGDINDLSEKILKNYGASSPSNLPDIYSFEKTSAIIINEIRSIK